MRVALFVTCFNDTLFPGVGRSVVSLLERLGCSVEFPLRRRAAGRCTPRAVATLNGIRIDALVGSGKDRLEQVDPDALDPPPELLITTAGKEGGTWQAGAQRRGTFKATELSGPAVDEYGAGETFAAGVTYALGAGYEIDDALAFAARAGAANLTGRGPYAGQFTAAFLSP